MKNTIMQYPGYHSSNHSNVLYYTPDVTQLPHYSESQATGIKHQETQMGWNVQMDFVCCYAVTV